MSKKTKLKMIDVSRDLSGLGYFDGTPSAAIAGDPNFRDDLRRFQRDYISIAEDDDGWYGTLTEAALLPLHELLQKAPPEVKAGHLCRVQTTKYYVADQRLYKKGVNLVPTSVAGLGNATHLDLEAGFHAKASLEGTGKLRDGTLIGVNGYRKVSPAEAPRWQPVLNIAKREGWLPDKAGYAGIGVDPTGTRVTSAMMFKVKAPTKTGFPTERLGIPLDPWRTIATDTGNMKKHDPAFKGKGGVVPPGTRVFILESLGWKLPDGSTHDGWWTANDTGGGIYGAHFDLFVGTPQTKDLNPSLRRAHMWFEGCEEKLGYNYSYGL